MRKFLIPAAGLLCFAPSAIANIIVSNPAAAGKTLLVRQSPLDGADAVNLSLTLDANGNAVFNQLDVPVEILLIGEANQPVAQLFSASPADNITVAFTADGNPSYSGTTLMNDIESIRKEILPIEEKAQNLEEMFQTNPQEAQALYDSLGQEYTDAIFKFLTTHADSPAAPYALLSLDSSDLIKAYTMLTPAAKESILMPLAESARQRAEKRVAAETLQTTLESGTVPAPAFTLPDLNAKQISLSDFKGKWVIIDFWGSWCRWCIKGFPELKDIYAKYAGKLEIIGVDCNETQERWKAGVEKYELPWVNVYLDTENDSSLLQAYAIQGFPTKVVVSPEGLIKKIVVGADPSFPETLATLMAQ